MNLTTAYPPSLWRDLFASLLFSFAELIGIISAQGLFFE